MEKGLQNLIMIRTGGKIAGAANVSAWLRIQAGQIRNYGFGIDSLSGNTVISPIPECDR